VPFACPVRPSPRCVHKHPGRVHRCRNEALTIPVGPALTGSSAFYLVWDARHLPFLPRKVAVVLSTLALCTGHTVMVTVPLSSASLLKGSASLLKGSRSAPLVRPVAPRAPHAPAYVAKLRKAWRVIVPVRGRLSPRVIARAFPSQSAALSWLASEEGQNAVAHERSGHRHSAQRSGIV
jgi:hypothetical protein